jgi:DNA-binding IclR family transcriptional regulator
MVSREKSNYVIQTVSNALDILDQFYTGVDEIGVTELSKKLKLHKNNVFRLLATLEARGYIEQNKATENYRLGSKCLQLGQTYLRQIGFLQQARSTLKELAKGTKESAFVTLRRGMEIVPLDFVEPENPVRVVSFLGIALPVHCTASGKVHLAFESEAELKERLPESLARYTDRTIVDRSELRRLSKPEASCPDDLAIKNDPPPEGQSCRGHAFWRTQLDFIGHKFLNTLSPLNR